MKVKDYLMQPVSSLLDVGCNVGAWLKDCTELYPAARLAGVEVNEPALKVARSNVPAADLRHAGAENLPFPDESFQNVTCIEVLEHLPSALRPNAFREIRRVLQPGGCLILTVPHAGWFAWLDSNNVRLRIPAVYRRTIGRGKRDATYTGIGRQVEWHHHFTLRELSELAGSGWKTVAVQRCGLVLYPLMDWLSWPFYRLGRPHHPVRQFFERVAGWDYRMNFGPASYGIMIVLQRIELKEINPSSGAKSGSESATVEHFIR